MDLYKQLNQLFDFKKYNIGDIGEVISGGTPKTSIAEYWDGKISWITPKDLSNNKDIFISKGERFITNEGLNNSSTKLVPKNTILMTSRAPIGYIAVAKTELCTNQGFKSLICDENICYYKYFYYWLKLNMDYIINNSSGSTFKEISSSVFKNLTIYLPQLSIQKSVSNILWNIDLKIQNLYKINQNLEKQCMLLYSYFFKDFKFSNDNEMKFSELGDIPSDWEISTIGSEITCVLGGTPSRSEDSYWGGDIAWINSGKVNEYRITTPSEYITNIGLNNSSTKLLPKKTTVIAITGATLGQVSLLEIDSCANQSVIGIVPNEKYPYEFIYPMINNLITKLLRKQTGGAQQHINKTNVEKTKFIVPSKNIMDKYVALVKPLYELISQNCFEIENLENLRDTLLPKLMNGEIDVSKIEIEE